MNAQKISDLICTRDEKNYIYIPECKTGQSYNFRRFDVWSLKKSWASFNTIGYEIKVSRQDFLNDCKWKEYLNFCNEFYFVAPKGIIDKNELPPEAGLFTVSSNCKMLYKTKRAIKRELNSENLSEVLKYIIFWRVVKFGKDSEKGSVFNREYQIKYWKAFLESKHDSYKLGRLVSCKLAEENEKLRLENDKLLKVNMELQEVKDFLKSNDIQACYYQKLIESVKRKFYKTEELNKIKYASKRLLNNIEEIQTILKDDIL